MQHIENRKRHYFSKSKKIEILNELSFGDMTHSELARKHGIHPVTIYKWKREMNNHDHYDEYDMGEVLRELKKVKEENEHLKKALGDMAVRKHILETANKVLLRDHPKKRSKSQKR